MSYADPIVFFWAATVFAVTIYLSFLLIAPEDRSKLLLLISVVFIFNLLTAFYFRSIAEIYFPDEYYYISHALTVMKDWKAGNVLGFFEYQHRLHTANFLWSVVNALHYFLITKEKMVVVISNVGFSIITGLFCYRLGRELFNRKVALLAIHLQLLNPNSIYWASFDLKDTMLTTAVIIAAFLYYTRSIDYIARYVLLVLTVAVITSIRVYLPFIILGVMGFDLLINSRFKFYQKAGIALIFLIAISAAQPRFMLFSAIEEAGGETEYLAYKLEAGGERFERRRFALSHTGTDTLSPKHIVLNLGHYILTPSMFRTEARLKYYIPGTLFWLISLPFAIFGGIVLFKHGWRNLVFLLSYSLGVAAFYTVIPWLGSSRHRLIIYPFIAVIAAVGYYAHDRYRAVILFLSYLVIFGGLAFVELAIL